MADYEIKFNKTNGWSYEQGDIPVESECVELSGEEVKILIELMKQKGTHNVAELNIKETHPDIYNKLEETCSCVAFDVATAEAARDAHYDIEDDILYELQEYCESEYNYDESQEDFRRWLYQLLQSWSSSQICDLYDKIGVELCWDILDFDGVEVGYYNVIIPQSIVEQVKMTGK